MINVPELRDSDPEVKKESKIYVTTASEDPLDMLVRHVSSWWKVKTAFAWMILYKQFLQSNVLEQKQGGMKTSTDSPSIRKGSNSTCTEISVPGNVQGPFNLFRRKASQKSYEEGSFIDFQIKPKVERRIIVSRRSTGECSCGWRYEISLYTSKGSSCHRTDNLSSPWETGSPRTGVCVVISQRKILDCKWTFYSASSFEELYWLPENKGSFRTTTDGKVTTRQSNSERNSVHACWSGLFRSNISETRQK